MKVPMERWLGMLIREMGSKFVFEEWQYIIELAAKQQGLSLKEFLKPRGLWDRYRRFVAKANNGELSIGACADILRQLQLSIHIDHRSRPWAQFEKGKTACVVIGDRSKFTSAEKGLHHRVAGAGDLVAQAELIRIAQRDLQLQANWESQFVSTDMSFDSAQNKLMELRTREDIGAVFVLGSPYTNPITDLVARQIMDERDARYTPKKLPFQFRWSHVPATWLGTVPYLSQVKPCKSESEGICLPSCGPIPTFKRTHDSEIIRDLSSGHLQKSYPDCGILMMSCRPNEPILCLMAGHGGQGTIAAVLALQQQSLIARLLDDTNDGIASNTMFAVVVVHRTKPTLEPIDDLTFDREYSDTFSAESDLTKQDQGWSIAYPILD